MKTINITVNDDTTVTVEEEGESQVFKDPRKACMYIEQEIMAPNEQDEQIAGEQVQAGYEARGGGQRMMGGEM